jgi:hypothetical protein
MTLNLRKFFQATNPSKTLAVENEEDQKYYIDFSSVRGGKIIEELKDNITFFSPDEPTCELFTGHIGCGKSTELLRLKADLEQEGFHVVYFESSQDLEMGDVDIGDILLAIARRVSESLEHLEKVKIGEPESLKSLLRGAAKLLQTEIELSAEASVPGIGKVAASTEGKFSAEVGIPGVGQVTASDKEGVSLVALGIGKITAKAKNSPELRSKLREYLEPRTNGILEAINKELLEPSKEKLKQHGNVRELLRLLNDWIKKNRELPLSRKELENVIRSRRNQMTLAITDDEWDLLRQVQERKQVSGDDGYRVLIRSMFVYEYRNREGSWFEVNPILAEAGRLNA